MKRYWKNMVLITLLAVVSCTGGPQRKNVILIIPDGCSVTIWAAIRAMTTGTDGVLNIDRMPIQGRCRTYAANAMITDSAAAVTAYACGVKTNVGVLGMDAGTVRGDSLTGQPVETILEAARRQGFATGLVTTSIISHATPAGFYSHRANRDWYELISNDLLDSGADVIMGGGREYMIPAGTSDEEGAPSKRTDGRNIIEELQKKGYLYVYDDAGFKKVDTAGTAKLLGLFNPGHMCYEFDRKNDVKGEPGLWEMTKTALDILNKNKRGFFLMVEAARIDHAGHVHDTDRFLWDGIACDKTVKVAREFAEKDGNTLVIVVPDHATGGPALVGAFAADSSVVSYDLGGFVHYKLDSDGFPVEPVGNPIAIKWVDWLGHTGEDVGYFALYGNGKSGTDGAIDCPVHGLLNNTDIYGIMMKYLNL